MNSDEDLEKIASEFGLNLCKKAFDSNGKINKLVFLNHSNDEVIYSDCVEIKKD